MEIVNFAMLPVSISPRDHRAFMLDVTTCSMLGEFLHRAVRPVSRRLVTINKRYVNTYTRIKEEQFDIHRIDERLTAIKTYSWIPVKLHDNNTVVLGPTASDFESKTCFGKLANQTQVFGKVLKNQNLLWSWIVSKLGFSGPF